MSRTAFADSRNDTKRICKDVERIVDYRYNHFLDCFEYLVRWKYFGPDYDTWERVSNIKLAHQHLNNFLKRIGQLDIFNDDSDDSSDQ